MGMGKGMGKGVVTGWRTFYRSSSSQLRSVLSDWTSAAITRIAMPRCSSTTRWPCPGISRHGWNCCPHACTRPRSYWTLGCIWAAPPKRQLASLSNCRRRRAAQDSPAACIHCASMAKRAKYLGKCSFMAVRLAYPRGPNEERVRELMMLLLLLLLPLKCLCHIRRNQSLQANRNLPQSCRWSWSSWSRIKKTVCSKVVCRIKRTVSRKTGQRERERRKWANEKAARHKQAHRKERICKKWQKGKLKKWQIVQA